MITLRLDKKGGINRGDINMIETDNKSDVYIIQLYKGEEVYNLTGKTVELSILEKKRGYGDTFNLPIYEATTGKIKLEVLEGMTKTDGLFYFQITVKDSTGLVDNFPIFPVEIKNSLKDDIIGTVVNSPYMQILLDAVAKAEGAVDIVNDIKTDYDTAKTNLQADYTQTKTALQKDYDTTKTSLQTDYVDIKNNIQSDYNATKTNIQNDYNSLRKVIMDENASAELQGQINDINSQLDNITPIVAEASMKSNEAISKSSDAIGKANNPIETILSSGQKIPYALWDDEAKEAIAGTTNITTNAGYDKNRGVDYPLKALTRDGKLSSSSEKIKNGILDIKINGAKKGKYYRLEWLGNGVELAGGNRLDILLSEYDKELYSSSSSSNKRDLITLNDGLGLNKSGDTTGVITRRYTSLHDNISIEVTYDGDVIGSYTSLNQELGSGYSFIIDESCYSYADQIYPIVCKKNGDVIEIAWKYNNNQDIRISFEKFGSNNLLQLANVFLIPSTNPYVNTDFDIVPTKTLINKLTDSLSPYMAKAINNADGDKISKGEYEFVGGCHGYNNGATDSIPTARMIEYKIRIDGRDISENGIYGGNKIDIIVINRIQGNNTKKSDGTGREIIEESINYTVTQGKIDVKNEIKALEDIKIYRNYGLQCYVNRWKTNGKIYFVNGVDFLEKDLNSSANAGVKSDGSNCRKMILSDGNDKLIVSLKNEGLGYKRYINESDKTAFWSNDKLYFHLINTYLTIPANGKLFYSGSWEFISE